MDSCKPNVNAIKNNLQARYRQKVKDEVPDNGACELVFVIIDALLRLTAEMLAQYDEALRGSIGDNKALRESMN
jgi:hypothetical protein